MGLRYALLGVINADINVSLGPVFSDLREPPGEVSFSSLWSSPMYKRCQKPRTSKSLTARPLKDF